MAGLLDHIFGDRYFPALGVDDGAMEEPGPGSGLFDSTMVVNGFRHHATPYDCGYMVTT